MDIDWKKGFTPIADIILEHLMKIRIPGEAMQIVLCVFLHSYGDNNKKWCDLKNKEYSKETGLHKVVVSKNIKKLIEMNLLIKNDHGHICFNKYFTTWKPLPKKVTNKDVTKKGNKLKELPKKVTFVTNNGNLYNNIDNTTPYSSEVSEFESVILKYKNFNFKQEDDIKWLVEKVIKQDRFKTIDIILQLQKWGNWLESEFRKFENGQKNKFPASNFKNSLLNFLNIELRYGNKNGKNRSNASTDQRQSKRNNPDGKEEFEKVGTGIQQGW